MDCVTAINAHAVAIKNKEWPKSKCAELFQRGSFAAGKGKKQKPLWVGQKKKKILD